MTKTKKQIILEAAARLFRDKGYSATSVRDLASAVDLRAPSLYNHVKGKEDILREICFQNAARFAQGMAQVEEMTATPAEKVAALVRLHLDIALEDFTSITAFNDEWRHLSEPHLGEFKALRRDYELRFRRILEEGIANGELQPIHPGIAFSTIVSAMRWVYDWYSLQRAGIQPTQLAEDITRLLLNGLKT